MSRKKKKPFRLFGSWHGHAWRPLDLINAVTGQEIDNLQQTNTVSTNCIHVGHRSGKTVQAAASFVALRYKCTKCCLIIYGDQRHTYREPCIEIISKHVHDS